MVGGQVLDMQSEERQCTPQEVMDIQIRKTGALIKAACQMGVIAAKGTEEMMRAAGDFAYHTGLAFQIRDDMLDVIGSAEEFGKPIGSDVEEGKVTYVDLLGVDGCQKLVLDCTEKAKLAVAALDSEGFLMSLADSLAERKK
jgi:geranylgeranyl diphosphate synthase type II